MNNSAPNLPSIAPGGSPLTLFGDFRVYTFTMLLGIIASIFSILYFWKKKCADCQKMGAKNRHA